MSDQSSPDRTGLCIFTFDDGRHCTMPHTGNALRLCYFHEKKEIQRLSSRDAGLKVSHYLASNLHTACDLSAAFVMLFRCGVQGHTDPKTLNALTKLGQLVLKTHLFAKDEYLATYKHKWPDVVEQSFVFQDYEPTPTPAAPQPQAPQSKPSR